MSTAIWAILTVLCFMAILACQTRGEPTSVKAVPALETASEIDTPTPRPVEVWARYPVPLDDDLQRYISDVCKDYEMSPVIVMAIIGVESQYQADKLGDDGQSWGLMQIYRTVHLGRMDRLGVTDLMDARQNVLVGVDLLSELMDCDRGIEWALTYYNGGGRMADYYDAKGEASPYAQQVMTLAECLLEGVQVQTNQEEKP